MNFKPSPQKRHAIDEKVRAEIGKGVAVEGMLDYRYTQGKNWSPYGRYMWTNGHTVFVGLTEGSYTVNVSEKPAAKNSPAVRKFWQKKERKGDREKRKE